MSGGNSVSYVRVSYATPDGNAAAAVPELAAKPESTVATVPVTVDLTTYAHWIEGSKQVLDDVTELQSILDGILRGGLLDVIDRAIYAAMTTSGNFTAFTPVTGETVGDAVARASAAIAAAGGQNIVVTVNPVDYSAMTLTKANTAGTYLGVPPNLASRVVAAPAVAVGKLLAFAAGSGAQWAEREAVSVVAGLRNDQFTRNAVSLLAEARGATLIRDPAHIRYGDAT